MRKLFYCRYPVLSSQCSHNASYCDNRLCHQHNYLFTMFEPIVFICLLYTVHEICTKLYWRCVVLPDTVVCNSFVLCNSSRGGFSLHLDIPQPLVFTQFVPMFFWSTKQGCHMSMCFRFHLKSLALVMVANFTFVHKTLVKTSRRILVSTALKL